jgi:Mrp family chromosome partitioning ATPase
MGFSAFTLCPCLTPEGKIIMNPASIEKADMLAEIAEMRRIFAMIEHSLLKSNPASLVVTSGLPEEGKTTMAAGLATIAARQYNKRVLVVDLHWYTPALHNWFGLQPTFDVEKFRQNGSITDQVQPSGIENLDILTARTPGGDEGLWFREKHVLGARIMNQGREAYDFVVADTSSIFPTNRRMMDPVTIAKAADGVALVVMANVTPRQHSKRANMFLENAGANVLGVVVNQWKNPLV